MKETSFFKVRKEKKDSERCKYKLLHWTVFINDQKYIFRISIMTIVSDSTRSLQYVILPMRPNIVIGRAHVCIEKVIQYIFLTHVKKIMCIIITVQ